MKNKCIYLVLTQTNTYLARIIKYYTKNKYSHISIAFDDECNEMYSFGRKYDRNPFIGMFKREKLDQGVFNNKNSSMAIYKVSVNGYQYKKIRKIIREIERTNKGYNIFGLLTAALKIKLNRKKYYCSEFVYEVLSNEKVEILSKNEICFNPEDIIQKDFKLLYEGFIKEY